MADEMHKLKRAATGKMRADSRREAGDEIFPEPQPDTPEPDATDVWKDRYLRLHADLENTKKRLARSSAQEVEAQKETLLRDLLPVADGLDLLFQRMGLPSVRSRSAGHQRDQTPGRRRTGRTQ